MTPIAYALNEIQQQIPIEVLREAFPNKLGDFYVKPIEKKIQEAVFENRVRPAMNLIGGQQIVLPLSQGKIVYSDPKGIVYQFSNETLTNRDIISVHSVTTTPPGVQAFTGAPNSLANKQQALMTATGSSAGPITEITAIDLVGKNTVLISDIPVGLSMYFLKCLVTDDPELSRMPPPTILPFANLFVLATKAYVYNNLRIKRAAGQIYGGAVSTAPTDVINDYASAEEDYQIALRRWQGIAMISDQEQHSNIIKMQISPFL